MMITLTRGVTMNVNDNDTPETKQGPSSVAARDAEARIATVDDYDWGNRDVSNCTEGLWPVINRMLGTPNGRRILDVGCGNGGLAEKLVAAGWDVTGIDAAETGIEAARKRVPSARFEVGLAEPGTLDWLNVSPFDAVISTEVVEHVYAPRSWGRGCFDALAPGGTFVSSTPYHGYLKNLAIALSGKFDSHFTALWDGGHIKFWSKATLTKLLEEVGFTRVTFGGMGRMPYLWKSMIARCERPER